MTLGQVFKEENYESLKKKKKASEVQKVVNPGWSWETRVETDRRKNRGNADAYPWRRGKIMAIRKIILYCVKKK